MTGAGVGQVGGVHVVLVGPMGAGKTTVGAGLAARLGRPLRDSDADLQASRGIRGREMAAREGVEALHRWEAEHLLGALAAPEPAVVAAAASVVEEPGCREALVRHFVVWLQAPARLLAARMSSGDHRRALTAGRLDALEALEALEARRAPWFASVADLVVDAAGTTPDEIVRTVLEALPADQQRIGPTPREPRGLAPRGGGGGDAPGSRPAQGVPSRDRTAGP